MRQFVVGLKARVHSSSEAEAGVHGQCIWEILTVRLWTMTLTSWVQSPEGTSGSDIKVLVGSTHGTLATLPTGQAVYMNENGCANPVKVSQLLQVSQIVVGQEQQDYTSRAVVPCAYLYGTCQGSFTSARGPAYRF
jgi:hypothetical protein